MSDQRQFRFRLPWLSAATTPRPILGPPPTRPTTESTQPSISIPVQRPLFRLAGIAPVQITIPRAPVAERPDPQPAVATERAPSQPESPTRASSQTRPSSVPSSPSRASQPASPVGATSQTGAESVPQSPIPAPPQPRTTSVPLSPKPDGLQLQPTGPQPPIRAAPQPRSTSMPSSPKRDAPQLQPTVPPPPIWAAPQPRTSVPSSPKRDVPQLQPTVPQPPIRAAPHRRTTSVPSSPKGEVAELQPAVQTVAQSQHSPGLIPRREGVVSSQPLLPEKPVSEVLPKISPPPAPKELQAAAQEPAQPPQTLVAEVMPRISTPPAPKVPLPAAQELAQPPPVFVQPPLFVPEQERKPQSVEFEQPRPTFVQAPLAAPKEEPKPLSTGPQQLISEIVKQDTAAPKSPFIAQKFDSDTTGAVRPFPPAEIIEAKQAEEDKKTREKLLEKTLEEFVEGRVKDTRTQDTAPEAPVIAQSGSGQEKETEKVRKSMEEAGGAGKISGVVAQAKELPRIAFDTEQRPQERKDKFGIPSDTATVVRNGKHIKIVSLPPPKMRSTFHEAHQKAEHIPLHKEIREDIFKLVRKLGTGKIKPHHNHPVSIVTVAGDNDGASMHLGTKSLRNDGLLHIHHGYKVSPAENLDTRNDTECSSKGRRPKHPLTNEDPALKAYINSNAQSVNHSIAFHSSVKENDPGIKLSLSQDAVASTKTRTITELLESKRAEFNATSAEKLTHEPTVRRQCLRGLFLESSNSDDENPGKPRRHRYNSCG